MIWFFIPINSHDNNYQNYMNLFFSISVYNIKQMTHEPS